MKKVILLAVLVLIVIEQLHVNAQSSANLLPNGAYSLTSTDQANFLNAHNAVRKAYNVNPLTWDTQLASDSAAYAAQCMDNPLTHSAANGAYGENLSTYMVSPNQAFPYKSMDYHVITGWYSEEKYWSCSANTCQTNQMCGHHTQIIWAATTSVGCGVANCQYTSGGTQWFVQNAVCRYKTAGNIVGQHPLGSASKCPAMPTTIGPLTPTAPVPTAPPPTPVAPVAPVTPPKTPVTPTSPKTPVTPTKPAAPTPVAPVPVPVLLFQSLLLLLLRVLYGGRNVFVIIGQRILLLVNNTKNYPLVLGNHGRIAQEVKLGVVLILLMNGIILGHYTILELLVAQMVSLPLTPWLMKVPLLPMTFLWPLGLVSV
jgi:hypothetical protein